MYGGRVDLSMQLNILYVFVLFLPPCILFISSFCLLHCPLLLYHLHVSLSSRLSDFPQVSHSSRLSSVGSPLAGSFQSGSTSPYPDPAPSNVVPQFSSAGSTQDDPEFSSVGSSPLSPQRLEHQVNILLLFAFPASPEGSDISRIGHA